jgi:hypothetical protein
MFASSLYDDHGMRRWNSMKASEFDRKFDNGENIMDKLDVPHARRPGEEIKRINVDFPAWMVAALDREARRLGVTRQSIIKMWLAEHLQQK